MAVFGQKWLYSVKVVVFEKKLLYLGKNGCTRAKEVVFEQKWLYSGEVVVLGQNLLYSGKVVVFG